LAIAQGMAQLHGGTITASSELGVGSCFMVPITSTPIAHACLNQSNSE